MCSNFHLRYFKSGRDSFKIKWTAFEEIMHLKLCPIYKKKYYVCRKVALTGPGQHFLDPARAGPIIGKRIRPPAPIRVGPGPQARPRPLV